MITTHNLTKPLKIFSIFLYTRPLFACPKKYGFKGVVDGTTLYKRCPLGYMGRKAVLACTRTTRPSGRRAASR